MLWKRTALSLAAKNKGPGPNSLPLQCPETVPAPLLYRFAIRTTVIGTSKIGVEGRSDSPGSESSVQQRWDVLFNTLLAFWRGAEYGQEGPCPSGRKEPVPSVCPRVAQQMPHLGYLTNWHSAHWVSNSACQIHAVLHCSSQWGLQMSSLGCHHPGQMKRGKEGLKLLLISEALSS